MEEKDFRDKYKGGLKLKKSPDDPRTIKASKVLWPIALPIKTNNVEMELPVKDQGSLPICAGCAGSEDQELMDVQDINLNEWLSAMYLYNNREDTNTDGMDNLDLMKIRQKKGTCLDRLYPIGTTKEPSREVIINALYHRIGTYGQVDTLDALKTVLASKRSVVVAVPVYNFTERMWYKRQGDVFQGGHDMKAVDYNDETRKILIKNSWGTEFGKNGYIEMDYDDFELAWEWWACMDLPSDPDQNPVPVPEQPKKWWRRNLWWLVSVSAVIIFFLIKLLLT